MSIRDSDRLVNSVLQKGTRTQPPKGAYGKRRNSRGLKGFYEPKGRRGAIVEYVGYQLVE
ncbi:hypothetical protein KAR91_54845 [Candidatus Pacearchaeota archaeon]|nr:hypothetical protein [Candidatus Pacearchaeota archaeon]